VNNPDGRALMTLADRGGEATIVTEMLEGWFMQKVPVATIPGTQEPEKYVLVHGHYDSWDVGVGDNATGDATLMELARVLWQGARSEAIGEAGMVAGASTDATPARPGSPMRSRSISIATVWHRSTATARVSLGDQLSPDPHSPRVALAVDAIRDVVPDADIKTLRPPQAGDYSFNISGCRASIC
jgi:hypothetical protein